MKLPDELKNPPVMATVLVSSRRAVISPFVTMQEVSTSRNGRDPLVWRGGLGGSKEVGCVTWAPAWAGVGVLNGLGGWVVVLGGVGEAWRWRLAPEACRLAAFDWKLTRLVAPMAQRGDCGVDRAARRAWRWTSSSLV